MTERNFMTRSRSRATVVVTVALACFLTSAVGGAVAQDSPRLVDRIVAIVDEEAILQSDLEREMELFRLEKEYAGEEITASVVEIRSEMLERLVESKLIIAAAKQSDMTVDDEAIQESVQEKIDQFVEHFGSLDNLQLELARSGMTLGDYKARMTSQLRDQQYLRLVVGKFIRPKVEVLENEVREYYMAHLDEMPAEPDSVTLSNILVPVTPAAEVRSELQNAVAAIQGALDSGRSFEDVAAEYSKGPNASRGGTVGVVGPGDLFDQVLDRAVFGLSLGVVSDPVISSRGVHILRVDAIQEDGRRALSQIFLPIEVSQADVDLARGQIESARQRVLDGEDFATVASEVSADPSSAPNGGRLGTFNLTDLSEQFQEVLADAYVGQITEPILTPAGWYVFLMRERVDGHRYTYEELKETLRQAVEGEKIEVALAEYVADLRTRFFIDEKS